MEVLQGPQDLLGYPDDLKLSHGPTAVQLFQDGAALSGLHEQVDVLFVEEGPIERSDVLVTESGLEFYVGRFKVLQRDL